MFLISLGETNSINNKLMKWKLFVINYQTQDKYTHKLIVISQEILLRIVSTKYNFIFLCSLHHFKALYEMQLEQTEKDKLKNIQQILLFCKKNKMVVYFIVFRSITELVSRLCSI